MNLPPELIAQYNSYQTGIEVKLRRTRDCQPGMGDNETLDGRFAVTRRKTPADVVPVHEWVVFDRQRGVEIGARYRRYEAARLIEWTLLVERYARR